MNVRALASYSVFEIKMFFREFIATFYTLILPAIIAVFVILRQPNKAAVVDIFQQYTPELAAILATLVAMFVLAGNLVLNREMGFFKRILAAPVKPDMIVASAVVRGLTVVAAATAELLLLCLIFSGELPRFSVPGFIIAAVYGCGCLFVLGFALASWVKKATSMFLVSNVAVQFLILSSDVGLAFVGVPENLQGLSVVSPLTHVINLMSLGWDGRLLTSAALLPAIVLGAITVVGVMVVRRYFTWTT